MTSALQSIPFGAFTEEVSDNGTIVTTHSSTTVKMSNVPGMKERVIAQIIVLSLEGFLARSDDRQREIIDDYITLVLEMIPSQQFPEMTSERRRTFANEVIDELMTRMNNAEAPVINPAVDLPDDILAEDNSENSLSAITDGDRSSESRNGASDAGSRDTSTLQGEGIPTENNSLAYSADGTNDTSSHGGSGTSNDESTSNGQQGDAPPKNE